MIEYPYLVGIVLIEQDGIRSMPLGGKSLKASTTKPSVPGIDGEKICLELLLRVMERSQSGALKQAASKQSILLLEIPLEALQKEIPSLKAEWISNGDSKKLISNLKEICINGWSITFEKHKGIKFNSCF